MNVLANATTILGVPRRSVLGGVLALAGAPALGEDRQALNRRVFDAVWRRVERDYYDARFRGVDWAAAGRAFAPRATAAPDEAELYRVLSEMLGLLRDAHARVSSPTGVQARERQRRQAVASGAGFDVRFAESRGVVTAVRSGSPAERAGIQAGWLLETINGTPFRPDASRPALPFDAVFLTPTDAPVAVRVQSADYAAPPERTALETEGVHYLRFDSFEDPDIDWAEARISDLESAPLLLDLRHNTGGRINQFERLIGAFFPRRITYAEFRTRTGRPIPLSFAGRRRHSGPLAVLVDKGTNSAAEIFAAVIQAHGRGKVIGEQTLGNVLGATDTSLPDGGRLTLSIRDLVLSSGRRLEGLGITPDVLAPRSLADFRSLQDPGVAAGLNLLTRTAGAVAES